jgi:hydroxymethylglutaryl-CoA lyase
VLELTVGIKSVASQKISIIEVGPRDGLQSEPKLLSTETKLEFINRAIDAGIRRMEVTSFVHPKRVPQMADAEAVVRGLGKRDGFTAIGLVLNKRGFDRARDCGIDEIGMAVIASETYNQRNNGAPIKGSIDAWNEMAAERDDLVGVWLSV